MSAFCGYNGEITITYKGKKNAMIVWWSYEDREYSGALVNPLIKEKLKSVSNGSELMKCIAGMYAGEYNPDAVDFYDTKNLIAIRDFSEVQEIKLVEKLNDYMGFGAAGQKTIRLTSKNNNYITDDQKKPLTERTKAADPLKTPTPSNGVQNSISFDGAIFVLTGMNDEKSNTVSRIIEENGGEIKSSTVLKTNYLIYDSVLGIGTVKHKRALELIEKGKPIQMLTYEEFMNRISMQTSK